MCVCYSKQSIKHQLLHTEKRCRLSESIKKGLVLVKRPSLNVATIPPGEYNISKIRLGNDTILLYVVTSFSRRSGEGTARPRIGFSGSDQITPTTGHDGFMLYLRGRRKGPALPDWGKWDNGIQTDFSLLSSTYRHDSMAVGTDVLSANLVCHLLMQPGFVDLWTHYLWVGH